MTEQLTAETRVGTQALEEVGQGITKQAGKKAAKEVGEEMAGKSGKAGKVGKAGKKIVRDASRSVPIVGVLLYFAFTAISAPSVKASPNTNYVTRGESIAKEKEETAKVVGKMVYFSDPNLEEEIIQNAVEGDGSLLKEMTSVMPAARAKDLTEKKAVEVIKTFLAKTNASKQVEEKAYNHISNGIQHKPYSAPYIPDMLP